MSRRICVTTALPYANGDLHLGHILEQIQADIWCRFQKMRGVECMFVGGDDAHGTAIMLSAEKKNISPEDWIAEVWQRHHQDLKDFHIDMDMFYTTRSEENQALVATIYQRLQDNQVVVTKQVKQAYDETAGMFLPDRFIRGTCPKCGAQDQYGDHCEQCSAYYLPTELKNPYSVISQTTPVERSSEHIFFALSQLGETLSSWIHSADLQASVKNKLTEWLDAGLQDWDISRDAPYFGFKIPGYQDKYFYVWMDAPVGYMAALAHYDGQHQTDYCKQVYATDSDWELVHFIGKDLVNFHGVFWPMVLTKSGHRPPSSLHVHGFITINGEKMSKSKGTFITARSYLDRLSPDYLRYYFACKMSDSVVDIDLNWNDFIARCNADLVGKVINIGSRTASFIHKYFSGQLATSLDDDALYQQFLDAGETVAQCYEQKKYHQAVREIMLLADMANQYVDSKKPWQMVKQPDALDEVGRVCTTAMHLFWVLSVYLSPVIPETSGKMSAVFGRNVTVWDDAKICFYGQNVTVFPRVLERLSEEMCPA